MPHAATVISVIREGSRATTKDVNVSLTDPVDGQQTVTVLVPSGQSFAAGVRVQVLVDPHDPGYAEIAGQQFMTDSVAWWDAAAVWTIAAGLAALVTMAGREWRKLRRGTR